DAPLVRQTASVSRSSPFWIFRLPVSSRLAARVQGESRESVVGIKTAHGRLVEIQKRRNAWLLTSSSPWRNPVFLRDGIETAERRDGATLGPVSLGLLAARR